MTVQTLKPKQASHVSILADLLEGLRRWQIASTFAADEIQHRYRRSYLGVLWIMVSYAIFVAGISLIFSAFTSQTSVDFIIHVAVGYAVFVFIIANLNDGADVFVHSTNWIKSVSLPFSIYVYRSIGRSIFAFALQLALALGLMVIMGWRPNPYIVLVVPAMAIFLLNAVAIQYLVGLIGARFRDFSHLLTSITRLSLFVTPILWVRDDIPGTRAFIVDFNPLTHYVEVFRAPLMGKMPMTISWYVVLGLTAAIWFVLIVVGSRFRRRLPFWI